MNERDIFLALLDLPDPAERVKYLDAACNGDTDLRARVERLIHSHESAGSFLDLSAESTRAIAAPDDAPTHAQGEQPDDDTDDALGFLAPARRPESLGRIGHYEVLEVLGRGGFGIVFRAFDDVLQRVVAVKVLAPSMAATSPARKRFLREARSAALIQHENVVRIHETGEEPLPFLVMEFVPGETLQHRLDRKGPLEVAEAIRISQQIAAGLAAAHEKGLVHRDIKPSNILIDPGPQQVKITDFGLARAADDASLTRSGVVAGTPMYMAPEQAKGETLDQRADLFSLGSVLYAMLTGHPPFRAPNTPAVLRRVAEDDPRPMREVIPEIPDWLCRIVEKLHAKDPAERFQSSKEVAELLTDCEKQLAAHKELTDFARIPGGKPKRRRRRVGRRMQWLVAAVVVCAGLYVWFGRSTALYLSDRGELDLHPADGLVSVIVLQNDEGDLVTDKLHTPVTDWLGMKERQTLKLPPGRYQVNVNAYPSGTRVDQWEVTTSGVFGSSQITVPVIRTSAIVTVERGQRTTLRAKMRTDPPRPEPPPSPQPTDGFVSLFNGKDLTGWKRHSEFTGTWSVENGILVGRDGFSVLLSEREYEDFHLRAEVRATGGTGIYFRATAPVTNDPSGWIFGFPDTSLYHDSPDSGKGWVMRQSSLMLAPISRTEWSAIDIRAVGDQITIKVNEKTVIDYRIDQPEAKKGLLALHSHMQGEIQFRKIEIKELPANSPEAPGLPASWRRFHVPGARFSVVLPDNPESREELIPNGTTVKLYGAEVQPGNALYLVSAVPIDANLKAELTKDPDEAFRRTLRGAIANAEIGQVKRITAGSLQGVEIVTREPTMGKHVFVRLFVIHDHIGVLIALDDAPTPSPMVQAYLNSLKVEEPALLLPRPMRSINMNQWGTLVDPTGACKVSTTIAQAAFTVPGDKTRILFPKVNMDAPRWLWDADGDFTYQVTVQGFPWPKKGTSAAGPSGNSYREAGFLVWVDENNFVRFGRAGWGEQQDGKPYWHAEGFVAGERIIGEREWVDGPQYHLQVERRGGSLILRRSIDGSRWTDWRTIDKLAMPPRVKVGLVALNNTTEAFHPVFENLATGTDPTREPAARPPEVPKRAADILAYINGTWASDRTIVVPKLPPEQARSIGQLTFDFVANGTVARGLTVDKQGHSTSLVLHAYDRANDRLNSWAFFDDGAVSASKFGVYNPASRRFLWTEPLPDGAQSIHDMDFVDANTVKSRNYDTDPAGNTVYESQATFTRTNQPPAVPKTMTDPKRPAEMKILDQLGGDWQNTITIKDAKSPDKPKTESVRATARPILGGRFVEVIEANETTKTSDYSLVWYDAGAKRYRQTLFSHGGYVIEFTGTWDDAAKTLTWKTADDRLEGYWTFPAADRRDFRHTIKEAGQVQSEFTGVARKVDPLKQK